MRHYALLNPRTTFAYQNGDAVEYPARDPAWPSGHPKPQRRPGSIRPPSSRPCSGLPQHGSADRRGAPHRCSPGGVRWLQGECGPARRPRPTGATARAHSGGACPRGARPDLVARLLVAVQGRAWPVAPKRFGVVGEAHLRAALTTWCDVEPSTLTYRAVKGTTDNLPYVLEVACGWTETQHLQRLGSFNFTPRVRDPLPAAARGSTTPRRWIGTIRSPCLSMSPCPGSMPPTRAKRR